MGALKNYNEDEKAGILQKCPHGTNADCDTHLLTAMPIPCGAGVETDTALE